MSTRRIWGTPRSREFGAGQNLDARILDLVRGEMSSVGVRQWLTPGTIPADTIQRMSATLAYIGTADYTITATSFTAVDTANLSLTLTGCSGADIRVRFGASMAKGTTHVRLSLALDGVEVTGSIGLAQARSAVAETHASVPWTIRSPAAGNHVLTLVALVDGGSGTVYANDAPITIEAEEIP